MGFFFLCNPAQVVEVCPSSFRRVVPRRAVLLQLIEGYLLTTLLLLRLLLVQPRHLVLATELHLLG